MPFTITSLTDPSIQPDDESLRTRISGLPEDIQFLILSTFATLNFDNLKCVVSLNSRIHAIFRMRLFHSLKLVGEDVPTFLQCSIPNDDTETGTQYARFRAICGSARRLTLVGAEITKVISLAVSHRQNSTLLQNVKRLVIREKHVRNGIIKEWRESISIILRHIKPNQICLNLGMSFSKTWQTFLQGQSVQYRLDGITELVQHGVPISNLEVILLILDDVEIQRYYLEDYIIPSSGQTSLKVIFVRCLPKTITEDIRMKRRLPKEIHVYAHWPGSHGLPLELVDSDIQDMRELQRITKLHQVDEKSVCGCCGN